MKTFLTKLKELLKTRVKDGDLSEDDFTTAVRQAAGHAGGTARAEAFKALQGSATGTAQGGEVREFAYARLEDLPDQIKSTLPAEAQKVWMAVFNASFKDTKNEGRSSAMAWGAVKRAGWRKNENDQWVKGAEQPDLDPDLVIQAAEGSHMSVWSTRLLSQIFLLTEDGKEGEVQVFPAVGKYKHSKYGEIEITPSFLKEIKANFDKNIYQQGLPLTIDLEHQSSLSGAAGWVKDLNIKGDDGMWATIEFNDRGSKLVAEDAYRYFSPEFYDKWTDPATAKAYENVLIGGALTNRPFFKGMDPIAVMTGEALFFAESPADSDILPNDNPDPVKAAEHGQHVEEWTALMKDMLDKMGKMKEDMDPRMRQRMEDMMSSMGAMMGQMTAGMLGAHSYVENKANLNLRQAAEPKKTEDGEEYPAGAYLYVPEADKPSTWKLRIWENLTDKVTRTQLGRAAAAFSPGGFRGQKVQLPTEDKPKVLAKLRGLYAKMEVTPEELPAYIRASLTEAGLSEAEASAVLVELVLDSTTQGGDMGMTEEESRSFAELRDGVKTLTERLTATEEARTAAEVQAKQATEKVTTLEGELKTASEQVADMRRGVVRKQLSEFIRENRLAFQGEVEQAVDRLENLKGKLTGEEFQEYLDEKEGIHKQLRESAMMTTVGHQGVGATGPAAEMQQAVRKVMTETPGISELDAMTKVTNEQPDLYRRYDAAHKQRARMGGREE